MSVPGAKRPFLFDLPTFVTVKGGEYLFVPGLNALRGLDRAEVLNRCRRRLKGRGAVVTGAASGIGNAIATAFIEAGASVLLCDVNAEGLDAAAHALGDHAIGRVTDVSDEGQVEGAMRAARDAFGSLDIVVNFAGFGAISPLTELPARSGSPSMR